MFKEKPRESVNTNTMTDEKRREFVCSTFFHDRHSKSSMVALLVKIIKQHAAVGDGQRKLAELIDTLPTVRQNQKLGIFNKQGEELISSLKTFQDVIKDMANPGITNVHTKLERTIEIPEKVRIKEYTFRVSFGPTDGK